MSEADRFSRSSQSAMSKSLDHHLPARNAYSMKIPGSIVLPTRCSLASSGFASSSEEVGLQLTLTPNKDPRTFEANSQGRDPITQERNSQEGPEYSITQ